MDSKSAWERLRTHLEQRGLKLTVQRRAIAEAFFTGDKHLSLGEILEAASKRRKGIGYATVYRTMRLLTEAGLAREHHFGEAQTRFEPHTEDEHHDHLICVTCGVIVEFEDPAIELRQTDVASSRGFEVVSHRHEVYVRCLPDRCRRPEGEHAGGRSPTAG